MPVETRASLARNWRFAEIARENHIYAQTERADMSTERGVSTNLFPTKRADIIAPPSVGQNRPELPHVLPGPIAALIPGKPGNRLAQRLCHKTVVVGVFFLAHLRPPKVANISPQEALHTWHRDLAHRNPAQTGGRSLVKTSRSPAQSPK